MTDLFGLDNVTDKALGGCHHILFDLMINVSGIHEIIGLKYCKKCKKIFKETLQEIKF